MKKPIFNKSVLPNGLTVISEQIESVRSVSIGVWIKTGSRFEKMKTNGIAHFLEHMVFKGTKRRSALKIAQSLEVLGGSLNAFTGKEVTCYYAQSLDIHLKQAIDVLSDMLCNSIFSEKEIAKEKMVIVEEIKAVKDTPEDYIFDIFQEKLFPNCTLGSPILGTENSISRFNRHELTSYWQKFYSSSNTIITAAGNVQHDKLVQLIEKYFKLPETTNNIRSSAVNKSEYNSYEIHQPINQAHLCMGSIGIPYTSKMRYPLLLLNTYLGGGMSSRLFQKLREKNGLAYSVYSFIDFYKDTGIFGVYIGTDEKKFGKAKKLLIQELDAASQKRLSESTLTKLKNQLKGNIVIGFENTSRRMSQLAKNEIYLGKNIDINDIINSIDGVTSEDIFNVAQQIIRTDQFTSVLLHNKN
ncbi:MAG: insulinase family protein [Calditrichia bacterium]|nr:insulinase family protein [Calditrichia bacterium]